MAAPGKPSSYTLRAEWLFPGDGEPLRGGVVTVAKGRIVSVGTRSGVGSVRELEGTAILPGLINAHTHLEFSELAQPLGRPGMPFPDWIREVITWRRKRDRRGAEAEIARAVAGGLEESLRSGATAVGEIASSDVGWREYGASPVHVTVFRELLGLSPQRSAALPKLARDHLKRAAGENVRPALSPHSPYTVRPEMVAKAANKSSRERVPLAMHLAESREELELLDRGGGPLVELLAELHAWDGAAIPRGSLPLDYLKRLASSWRALVVHGNYLTVQEMNFLAAHRRKMSIVYCPRTHAYFGHEPYPLADLLRLGVRVVLGTDSRATNPDLQVLGEIRQAARTHPHVSPRQLLSMATIDAAAALGRDDAAGSLAPGKRADMAIVALDGRSPDPWEQLVQGSRHVETIISGRSAWSSSCRPLDAAGGPRLNM